MISGRSRLTTYEKTENLKPGTISSVTAAPPTSGRRSSTTTFRPARARYAAATRPLCPPPMMIASYRGARHARFRSGSKNGSLRTVASACLR